MEIKSHNKDKGDESDSTIKKVSTEYKLILSNFRCYPSKTYIIKSNTIILVKGSSGKGKSTIFQAIYWILYGKMKHVEPNADYKGEIFAELQMPDIIIRRQKKPEMVKVTFKMKLPSDEINLNSDGTTSDFRWVTQDGQVAEATIIKYFGLKDVWNSTSYLLQGERNLMLQSSNASKMELLHNLAFNDEDPEVKVAMIQEEYSREQFNLHSLESHNQLSLQTFNNENQRYQSNSSFPPPNVSNILTSQQIQDSNSTINSLLSSVNEYTMIFHSFGSQFSVVMSSRKQVQDLSLFLSSLVDPGFNMMILSKEILDLRTKIELIKISNMKRVEIDKIETELSRLDKELGTIILSIIDIITKMRITMDLAKPGFIDRLDKYFPVKYTQSDLVTSMSRMEMRRSEIDKCKRLSVEYDRTAITHLMTSINLSISNQEKLRDQIREKERIERDRIQTRERIRQIQNLKEQRNRDRIAQIEEIKREISNSVSMVEEKNLCILSLEAERENISKTTKISLEKLENELKSIPPLLNQQERERDLSIIRGKIVTFQSMIDEISRRMKVLRCPDCKVILRYTTDGLIKDGNEPPEDTRMEKQAEIDRLQKDLLKIENEMGISESNKVKISEIEWRRREVIFAMESKIKDVDTRIQNNNVYIRRLEISISDKKKRLTELISSNTDPIIDENGNKKEKERGDENKNEDTTLPLTPLPQPMSDVELNRLRESLGALQRINFVDESSTTPETISLNIRYYELRSSFLLCQNRIEEHRRDCERLRMDLKFDILDVQKIQELQKMIEEKEKQKGLQAEYEMKKQASVISRDSISSILRDQVQQLHHIMEPFVNKHIKKEGNKEGKKEGNKEKDGRVEITSDMELNFQSLIRREIESMNSQISELRHKLLLSNMTNNLFIVYNISHEASKKAQASRDRILDLAELKQKAIDVSYRILQETVDTLNELLMKIGNSLFDDPIIITLRLSKELKSTSKVKQIVNILIQYKNAEYENVSQLSGGEGDRVSLALTIALFQLSSSPFLILDESFAALDATSKEACIATIRGHTEGKTVLIVNHEATDGYYDHVIDVEEGN